jgi:hypothetical protein
LRIDLDRLLAARNAGCPAFRGHRVYENDLMDWLAKNPEPANGPAGNGETGPDWSKQVRMEDALLRRLKRERIAGTLVPRAWVGERIMRMCGELSALQARSEAEHPVRMAAAGGDVASNRAVLRGIWDEIRAAMQRLGQHLDEDIVEPG